MDGFVSGGVQYGLYVKCGAGKGKGEGRERKGGGLVKGSKVLGAHLGFVHCCVRVALVPYLSNSTLMGSRAWLYLNVLDFCFSAVTRGQKGVCMCFLRHAASIPVSLTAVMGVMTSNVLSYLSKKDFLEGKQGVGWCGCCRVGDVPSVLG